MPFCEKNLPLRLSAEAASLANKNMEEEDLVKHAISISLESVSDLGIQYSLDYIEFDDTYDYVTTQHGVILCADNQAVHALRGVTISEIDVIVGGGFLLEAPEEPDEEPVTQTLLT
jgi:Fe-S cluster assembly iron-binding protein IscA